MMRHFIFASTVLAISLTLTAVSVQAAEAGKYQAVAFKSGVVLVEISTGRTWQLDSCRMNPMSPEEFMRAVPGAAEPCWVPVRFQIKTATKKPGTWFSTTTLPPPVSYPGQRK